MSIFGDVQRQDSGGKPVAVTWHGVAAVKCACLISCFWECNGQVAPTAAFRIWNPAPVTEPALPRPAPRQGLRLAEVLVCSWEIWDLSQPAGLAQGSPPPALNCTAQLVKISPARPPSFPVSCAEVRPASPPGLPLHVPQEVSCTANVVLASFLEHPNAHTLNLK